MTTASRQRDHVVNLDGGSTVAVEAQAPIRAQDFCPLRLADVTRLGTKLPCAATIRLLYHRCVPALRVIAAPSVAGIGVLLLVPQICKMVQLLNTIGISQLPRLNLSVLLSLLFRRPRRSRLSFRAPPRLKNRLTVVRDLTLNVAVDGLPVAMCDVSPTLKTVPPHLDLLHQSTAFNVEYRSAAFGRERRSSASSAWANWMRSLALSSGVAPNF